MHNINTHVVHQSLIQFIPTSAWQFKVVLSNELDKVVIFSLGEGISPNQMQFNALTLSKEYGTLLGHFTQSLREYQILQIQ